MSGARGGPCRHAFGSRAAISAEGLPVADAIAGSLPAAIDAFGAIGNTGAVRALAQSLTLTDALAPAGRALAGAELLLQALVVVARALAMRRIVLPVFDTGAAVDVDAAAA